MVAVVAMVALGGCDPADDASITTAPGGTNATVVRVVDGDTIVADIGGDEERVRLIGIDTPESVKPDSPVECFGPEASAFTASLLAPGTAVRLVRDVEPRDDFDRLLAYVFLADGTFVNLELLDQGYATPLRIEPNTAYADRFAAAADDARRQDLGLWGACPG